MTTLNKLNELIIKSIYSAIVNSYVIETEASVQTIEMRIKESNHKYCHLSFAH